MEARENNGEGQFDEKVVLRKYPRERCTKVSALCPHSTRPNADNMMLLSYIEYILFESIVEEGMERYGRP